ncbi:hypothetical protein GCM10022200_07250 [Microbacterium awajiense]|uniref:OmpR/PhoB-type domain-containing protein n=1 Tax=Microbacterium awajiense TaxID=415214 RepID=A0ABP7A9E3_9MICO
MTVCVLGPLETDGPGLSPRERTILSALVVRRQRTVSRDELADACWGDRPPQTWTQQIQNAIAKIRSRLGPDVVRTIGTGYRLGVPDEAVDAVRFEQEVSQARRHALEGAHDRAAVAYRRALEMWRGDPYLDVPDWAPAQAEAIRLREIHADVEEELLDARLRLGEDATVIPDAERMVRAAPLREHRWSSLALANYRAGRQAEAIAVVRAARARFVEELGIDVGRELHDLEIDILRQDPSLEPAVHAAPGSIDDDAVCPYRGLAPYDADDAALFFGRDRDVQSLLERARPGTIVTIVGPSGSGKSSVLRAGVVPRLRDQGRRVAVVTPDAAGIAELRTAIAEDASVVAIDQAEELLTSSADDVRDLAAHLRPWIDRGGTLLLTLRSDFLDRATALPELGTQIGQIVYALSPMDADRLRRAITGPAEAVGLALETGLTEVILRDAGTRSAILPALSHALAATWARRDGNTLTLAGYEASGGIAGAIAQSAERVYLALSEPGRHVCHSLLLRLIERTPEAATVRRRVPLEALTTGAMRRRVVESLVAARLVTIDRDSAIIAHEAVGEAWPRLDAWLTADAEDARMLRQIEGATTGWDATGRQDDDLLRGARLQAVREWRERASPELTSTESEYIEASVAAHRDELRELEEHALRERASNRRLRVTLAGAAILLVATVVASAVAVVRGTEAEAAAEDARVEALTTTALSTTTDRETAALLAAEIHRRWSDDPRAFTALQGVLDQADGLVRTIHFPDDSRVAAAVVPRTRTALVAIDRPTGAGGGVKAALQLVDLTTGEVVRELDATLPPLGAQSATARDVTVSDDGSTALIVSATAPAPTDDGCCTSLTAVPLREGGIGLDPIDLPTTVADTPVLSTDGTAAYLLLQDAATPARLDLRTGRLHHGADPASAGGERDLQRLTLIDDRLYVGARDHLRVYDPGTLALIDEIGLPVRRNVSMTSGHLGSDGADGVLALSPIWAARVTVPSGDVVWARSDLSCSAPIVLPESTFVCTRADGLWVHSLDTGEPLRRVLPSLPSGARTVAWMPGVAELVTLTAEPALLHRWRPAGGFAVQTAADMRDVACGIAGRQFTPEEWARYFPDDEYRPTCPVASAPTP